MFGFDGPFGALSSLTIAPPGPIARVIGDTIDFGASGGTGGGYVYTLLVNNSGASIDSGTGFYTAGSTPNVSDTVRVTDSGSNTDDAVVNVKDVIDITPDDITLLVGATQDFNATGGVTVPLAFQILVNNSGCSLTSPAGLYTAGATGGVTDTIRATDAQDNSGIATIFVAYAAVIIPANPTKAPQATQLFTSSGGSGTGKVWSITVNNSGGTIDPDTGFYTAGVTGSVTDTIQVVDDLGYTATTSVLVSAAVSIAPANPTVLHDATQLFVASGGSNTGFVWSITVNNSGGTIDSMTGLYTAGPTFGVSDTVHVVDSLGNVKNTTVDVSNLIALWDITVSPDTQGSLRFTLTDGALFDLSRVHEGDLAYIYGDEFGPSNTNGTYTITRVSVTYDPDLIAWFEIQNPLGEELLEVTQTRFEDLMFFRPKRRTIYDNPRRAIVCEKAD